MRIAILVIGILGVLLGLGIAVVSLLLPSITPNVSSSEAMLGVIGGGAVLVLSLIIAVVGLVLVLKRKR